jgi:hypothetical protein
MDNDDLASGGRPAQGYLVKIAATVFRSRSLRMMTAAVCLTALPAPALWAQGPLQRLGERIRARAALQPPLPDASLPSPAVPLEPRVRSERPPLPPVVPPSGAGTTRGSVPPPPGAAGYRNLAPSTGSANYNRARSPLPGPPTPSVSPDPVRQQQAVIAAPVHNPATEAVAATPESTPPPRARLGATVDTPPAITVEGQAPRRRRGAWVTEVLPQSPADVAGLRVGDLIVSVQGRVITNVRDLIDELSQYSEGDELRIDYARDQALQAATVTLAGPDGLARQLPSDQGEPAAANDEERSLLGGIGSIFGGLLGGQPSGGSSAPAPPAPPAPQSPSAPASEPQPPPPPQATLLQPQPPLQPFEGVLETLPAPVPEQP